MNSAQVATPQKVSKERREGAIYNARKKEREKRTDLRSRIELALLKVKAILFALYNPRRATPLWQWVSRIAFWQKFGRICFESHATMGDESGRSKRWSMAQKALIELLGIVDVTERFRRCQAPEQHHRGCLCNRNPRNRTRRSNETKLLLDQIERLYVETIGAEERAELEEQYKKRLSEDPTHEGSAEDELDEETEARFELRERVVALIGRFPVIKQFATAGNANTLLALAKKVDKSIERLEADVELAVLRKDHTDDPWGWVKTYVSQATPPPAETRERKEEAKPSGAAQMKPDTSKPRDKAMPEVIADLRLPFEPKPLSPEELEKRARDRNRAPP